MKEVGALVASGALALVLLSLTIATFTTAPVAAPVAANVAPAPPEPTVLEDTVVEEPVASISPATTASLADRGRGLFLAKGCGVCHSAGDGLRSRLNAGPDLRMVGTEAETRREGLNAEAYLRESIRAPQVFLVAGFGGSAAGAMPSLPVSDEELDALVAFLLTRR